MKLNRICSEFKYGDWIIHKYGINEDGNPVHVESVFRDFFYFKADQIGNISPFEKIDIDLETTYKTLYGDEVYKVYYTSIKEKKAIDDAFPNYTYESDVKPEFKYLMKNKNLRWSNVRDRHIFYFDIETWSNDHEMATANNPHASITSIQGWSSREKKFFVFTWHEELTADLITPAIETKGDKVFIFCNSEEDTIRAFIEFLRTYSVDIITGWWSSGFDLPYIINRCQRINLLCTNMSPINQITHYNKGSEWKTYIAGLDHIDLLDAVLKMDVTLSNNKLDTAAKELLGDANYGKITESSWKDWKENYAGFLKYCIRDVEILREIDKRLGIFDLYCTVQGETNITQLSDIHSLSSLVDKYILSECRDEYVFPTRRTQEHQNYMGAIVLDPKPGLHTNVGLVDYASLYPTSIMTFNLSPETFICSDKIAESKGIDIKDLINRMDEKGIKYVDTGFNKELFGTRYLFYAQQKKIGLLPRILKKMYFERKDIKKKMKPLKEKIDNETATEEEKIEYKALDKRQYSFKIILNSAYGAFGFNYFRLYKPEVADSITFFARRALEFAMDSLKNCGYEVIYGDSVDGKSLVRLRSGEEISIEELYNNGNYCVYDFNGKHYVTPKFKKHKFLPYYNEKTKTVKYGEVEFIMKHKTRKKRFKVTLENGSSIIITEDHSLMVNRNGKLEEKTVNELDSEDNIIYLIKMETKLLKIIEIEELESSEDYVYDIHMKDSPHTFFANNILVHNTDSCFFTQNGKTNEEINEWVEEFNSKALPAGHVARYNNGPIDEYQMMELEYEKDLERIYFGDSKKRYYGIIRNLPSGDNKYIRGLNIIRKDAPNFLKDKLNELSEMAVMGTLTVQHLLDLRKEIEQVPLVDLGIPKKFGKRFEMYEKNQPQHLKAAKFANEHLGTKITHMDIPYLFYMISHVEDDLPKGKRSKAICLLEEDLNLVEKRKDVFEIDYETFYAKQVIDQLKEFEYIDSLKKILEQYKKENK